MAINEKNCSYQADYTVSIINCKSETCELDIGQGELRITAMSQTREVSDYHIICFFKHHRPTSVQQIKNFASLTVAEQNELEDRIVNYEALEKFYKKPPVPVLPRNIGANEMGTPYEKDGTIYDSLLILSDLQNNNNKFYKIQIFKTEDKFQLYNSWGRINKILKNSKKLFDDETSAIKEFKKSYKAKTKNVFGVEPVQSQDDSYTDIGFISNSNWRSILQDIRTLIEGNGTRNQLISATNKFFTLIPHDVGRDAAPLLNSIAMLKEIEKNLIEGENDGGNN